MRNGQASVPGSSSIGLAMMASSSRSSKMAGFWRPIAASTAIGARGASAGVGSESRELRLAVVSLETALERETALEGPVESEVALATSPSPSPAPAPAPASGISRCGATGCVVTLGASVSPPLAGPL